VRATGQAVAVKVQRPGALSTISKDLYVMRRGVGVYEQLVKRFTAQTTDYQQLLSTFAEGLYTEMDFRNEVRQGPSRESLFRGGGGQGHHRVLRCRERPEVRGGGGGVCDRISKGLCGTSTFCLESEVCLS
jgi:hypothetical protein